MSYATAQLLTVVRAVGDDWHAFVREQVESGRNFFLILSDDPDAISRFCRSFDLQPDCLHDRFTRSDLMLMGHYVDSVSFDEMLAAWDNNEQVVFLEQLDFPINRPPHVKTYMVYSPLWGILSQHDDAWSARRALEEISDWSDRTVLAQPAVYQWTKGKWKML